MFTVVWHVDECVEHKLRHGWCYFIFVLERWRVEVEGKEKERVEEVGEKKIKRGRLGGGAHEGEALGVLMLYLAGPSCHHDVVLQSLPVRRGSLNSILHPSSPLTSSSTHITPPNIHSVCSIQTNTACKQRERTRTRLSLFAATSRDVKWSFGMAINPIQIVLITVRKLLYWTVPT